MTVLALPLLHRRTGLGWAVQGRGREARPLGVGTPWARTARPARPSRPSRARPRRCRASCIRGCGCLRLGPGPTGEAPPSVASPRVRGERMEYSPRQSHCPARWTGRDPPTCIRTPSCCGRSGGWSTPSSAGSGRSCKCSNRSSPRAS